MDGARTAKVIPTSLRHAVYRAVAAGALTAGLAACSTAESTGSPQLAQVALSPGSFSVMVGDTVRFTPQALDDNGDPMAAVFTWGATGGTVASTGLFTAGASAGPALVWASTGGVADTVAGTVTSTPVAAVDTVFAEGFESNSFAVWDDQGRPANQSIVTTESHTGARALRIAFPAGSADGGWLTKFFMPGYDSVYVSYWVKLQAGWDGATKLVSLTGSRTDNAWSAIGTAGTCPTGTNFFVTAVTMDQSGANRFSRFYSYYPAMPRESDGVTCYGSFGTGAGEGATYSDPSDVPPGGWHHVEFWVRLNTPGQTNSVQKFWIDGVLKGTWTGRTLRTSTILMLNGATITASRTGGTAQVLFVDDFLVARARPGGTD